MKVLLVDDYPLILSALKVMIERLQSGVVVRALSSAAEVRALLNQPSDHDLMLLDQQLHDAVGFELLREVRKCWPEQTVVMISDSDSASDVIQAIDLGAMGFLPKRLPTEALADALRMVIDGGIFVPSMSMGMGAPAVAQGVWPTAGSAPAGAQTLKTTPLLSYQSLGITPRQADVLRLVLQGKSNKEIARQLELSVETVKDHVRAVLRALGVGTRTQAVLAVGELMRKAQQDR